MGHRANFIIIENNEANAYYDNWAALGCTFLALDGPAAARKAAETCEPTEELLDWAFAEAGYLLDYDENCAVFFGVPDVPDLDGLPEEAVAEIEAGVSAFDNGIASFLATAAPEWKGWTLRWDNRGVDAFSEHLTRRGIESIKTQPASHPDPGDTFELVVPV